MEVIFPTINQENQHNASFVEPRICLSFSPLLSFILPVLVLHYPYTCLTFSRISPLLHSHFQIKDPHFSDLNFQTSKSIFYKYSILKLQILNSQITNSDIWFYKYSILKLQFTVFNISPRRFILLFLSLSFFSTLKGLLYSPFILQIHSLIISPWFFFKA